jgi:hypothetical protein
MEIRDEVIVKVEVDGNQSAALDDLAKLKKAILEIKQEQSNLQKSYKSGQTSVSDYAKESVRLEVALKKANAAYVETQRGVTGVKTKMDNLIDSNKELAKGVAETNKELGKMTKGNNEMLETLKESSGTIVDKLVPGLGGAVGGIDDMNKASLRFVMNPIGAVIAALGLALKALMSYFKGSAEGQNEWNKIAGIGQVILGKLSDAVQALGKFIYEWGIKPLQFYIKVYERLAQAVGINTQAIRDYFEELSKQGLNLARLKEEITLLERGLTLQREVTNAKIADLKLQLEDKNIPLKERIALSQQIQRITEQQGQLEIDLARKRLELKKAENATSNSTNEDLLEETKLQADLFKIEKDIADKKKEAFAKEQALIQEDADARRKAIEDRYKLSEEERKKRLEMLEEDLKMEHEVWLKRKEFEDEFYNNSANVYENFNKRLIAANASRIKKETEDKRKAAEIETKIEVMKNQALAGGVDILFEKKKGVRVALNALFKKDAIFETMTNTYAAAIAAYKSMASIPYVGPVLGAIAAGAVTAFGLAQVAAITGLTYARGGKVGSKEGTFKGPDHSRGGIKYFGTDGNVIEVEGGENFYVLNKRASKKINELSALNVATGGTSFATKTSYAALGGQIEVSNANNNNSAEALVRGIQQGLSKMRSVVYVEDIRYGIESQTEVEVRSQVG